MKKLVLPLFLLLVLAVMCQAANVTFTCPTGCQLTWKQAGNIAWTYSGHPASSLVKLVLFKGGTGAAHKLGNIVQNISLGSGSYAWNVGEYEGGFAGAGTDYYLKIVSMNGDFNYYSNAFPILLPKIPPFERYREYVDLNPDPGCPMCGVFNIGDLLERLGHPGPDVIGDLVILRGGRQVGLLGKLGHGGLSANQTVKLQFGADDFSLLGKQNQGFEVAIMGAQGNILKRQAISLKLR
jgi:hypothetical protein